MPEGNELVSLDEVREVCLTKDNTEEYEPTGDYHPATKKYVDENAGSGGPASFFEMDGGGVTATFEAICDGGAADEF